MPGFVQIYCRTGIGDNEREHSNSRETWRPCNGTRLPSYRILPFNASLLLGTSCGIMPFFLSYPFLSHGSCIKPFPAHAHPLMVPKHVAEYVHDLMKFL